MPYNTGNPLGSASLQDLSDNAQNLDTMVNSTTQTVVVDRLGNNRKTMFGYQQDWANFLTAQGQVNLGNYAAGLVISSYNTTFVNVGIAYRAAPTTTLPYTTTGTWASESTKFVVAGDTALRSDLAANSGAGLIGFKYAETGAATTTVQNVLRNSASINVTAFGAVGDGVTDDTAALVAAEAAAFGAGRSLLFPGGKVFKQVGSVAYRVSITGYGATLLNAVATEQSDPLGQATVRLTQSNIFIEGLTISCNSKSAGISVGNTVTGVGLKNVTIVNPTMAGASFVGTAGAYVVGLTVSNVKCNSVDKDAADGLYALDCPQLSFTGVTVAGFERSGVFVKQTVNAPYSAEIRSVVARTGRYGYGVPAPTLLAGVSVDSCASLVLDGVSVSDMPNSSDPSTNVCAGVSCIVTSSTPYTPAWFISRIQVNGQSVGGGNLKQAIALKGTPIASIIVDTLDIRSTNLGVVVLGAANNISISRVVGRNMVYNLDYSGLVLGLSLTTNITSMNVSDVTDISPVITPGSVGASVVAGDSVTNTIISTCPSPITFNYASTNLTMANCAYVTMVNLNQPSGNITITGSNVIGTVGVSYLLPNNKAAKFANSSFTNFTLESQAPQQLSAVGCRFFNSIVSIATGDTTLSGNTFILSSAGSPIRYNYPGPGSSGWRCNITGNTIDMSDNTAFAVARIGSNTPANYILSSNVRTGGMTAITNFATSSSGLAVNNLPG